MYITLISFINQRFRFFPDAISGPLQCNCNHIATERAGKRRSKKGWSRWKKWEPFWQIGRILL